MKDCTGRICGECPYLKNAPAGYFGGNKGEIYAAAIMHDKAVPCHKTQDTENERMCSGMIATRLNSFKMARDPNIKRSEDLMRLETQQRERAFKNTPEFLAHHKIEL